VKKAQVSMEYLAIMGITLMMLLPIGVIVSEYLGFSNEQISMQQANEIARKITDNAETVYFLGYPSKITLKMYFPENIISADVMENGVLLLLDATGTERDIYQKSAVNLTGELPISSGIHYIKIQALQKQVNISTIV